MGGHVSDARRRPVIGTGRLMPLLVIRYLPPPPPLLTDLSDHTSHGSDANERGANGTIASRYIVQQLGSLPVPLSCTV